MGHLKHYYHYKYDHGLAATTPNTTPEKTFSTLHLLKHEFQKFSMQKIFHLLILSALETSHLSFPDTMLILRYLILA